MADSSSRQDTEHQVEEVEEEEDEKMDSVQGIPTGSAEAAGGTGPSQQPQYEMYFIEETGKWSYTDADGISFEYDEAMKAWFPMFNEQLIQAQQSAYGETISEDLGSVYAENAKRERQQKRKKNEPNYTGSTDPQTADHLDTTTTTSNKKPKKERKPRPVTSVYITGLPLDTDLDEIASVFKKGGVFMEDEGEKPRIKMYESLVSLDGKETKVFKGEALVTYLRPESVALAIDLLDDTEYRPGVEKGRIRVSQAVFQEKEKSNHKNGGANNSNNNNNKASSGSSTPSTPGGTKTMDESQKKQVTKKFQKLGKKLDWFEGDDDSETLAKAAKWLKVCILKHMFTVQEMEQDPTLLLDLKEDIREECEKLGEVTNVVIYDHHPEGIVSVRFREKESADLCVKMMNGRFFAGQRVEAEIYDGHTKYESNKSAEEIEKEDKARLDRYAKWLETQEGGGGGKETGSEAGESKTDSSASVAETTAAGTISMEGIAADAPTP